MTEINNEDRAEWALIGLQTFANRVYGGGADLDMSQLESFEQAMGDLLGNLMHYSIQNFDPKNREAVREQFDTLLERGYRYFDEELDEEAADREVDVVNEMQQMLDDVKRKAEGDSNDDEIQALQEALDNALTRWPELTRE